MERGPLGERQAEARRETQRQRSANMFARPGSVALGVAQFGYSETDSVGCMMFRNHAVKCWGPNLFGQLGTGRRSAEEIPIFQARDVKF